ncbi:ABC transporter permease [Actinopolymorpha pittospori]|uniref:Spermidine/putrescine transport system permease protein n=1 Tax=Actinopolymorpha pittospori TaxID=648752 RepID=A0A927RQJ3_9ACTN|nr:ABC transporter permease [Actinopolymorpha pittospori]MBE1613156.1 putative spermidine/putrescine transport system permease protein [Actinopolymorpha pittospori]
MSSTPTGNAPAAPSGLASGRPSGGGRATGEARRWRGAAYAVPLVVFLVALFLVPLVQIVVLSFRPVDSVTGQVRSGFTTEQYTRVFTESFFSGALVTSILTAVLVMVLCVVLAYPVAYVLARRRPGVVRTVLFVIVISPLLTSVVVRTYGWVVLFSANGLVNRVLVGLGILDQPAHLLTSYTAVVVSVTHVLLPFAIIPLTTALGGIDENVRRASQILGAGPLRTFFRITVPLSLPGMVTGALVVFALAMGIYITPLLVGGSNQPLAGIRAYNQITSVFNFPVAAALSLTLLVITVLSTSLLGFAFRTWQRRLSGTAHG